MSNIFSKRIHIKPYEYPELLEYKDAIRNNYWIHTEFNISSDIQDYHVNTTEAEKMAITRCMLAISQIEVSVKRFWSDIYHSLQKPEIDDVGATFAESEVRHKDAYSFLLEKLGLNDEFKKIYEIPAIIDRVEYLEYSLQNKNKSNKDLVLSIILFSSFIEHISLFSQFYIMMSFNKYKNRFKGISNIVEATSKEEEIHGRFGIHLCQIIKDEYPELFTEDLNNQIIWITKKALKAENKILDWIYEYGNLESAPRDAVESYITNRFNRSLSILDIDYQFPNDESLLKDTEWFDIEVLGIKENDFFYKRSTDYSKKMKSITADDLF